MTIWALSGVNKAKEGFVQIINENNILAQFSVGEARDFAQNILQAAEAAEHDSFVFKFMSDEKFTDQQIAAFLSAFRKFREARGGQHMNTIEDMIKLHGKDKIDE